jgi:predicted short-subunit dehydrogenase-like oxidoreductase (DUF2520 family)
MASIRIIGPGRAGSALALALTKAGWDVAPLLGRSDDPSDAAAGVDLLVIATPDDAVATVARAVRPVPSTVVAHLSGALGLESLAPHPRRAGLHPLVALPNAELGAQRLVGAWYGVAGGEPVVGEVVAALEGRAYDIDDERRALYHAAASIASNHLVALLGQVERLAAEIGVPFDAYRDLVDATLANVDELGPRGALTGPAARGDDATIRRHLEALPAHEHPAYHGMVDAARRLAGTLPSSVDNQPDDPDDATEHGVGDAESTGGRDGGRSQ